MPRVFNLEEEATWREAYGKTIHLLSYEEGWALQDAMVRGMSSEEFQRKLHAAWNAAGGDTAKQQHARREQARREICMEVQGPILQLFGFAASFAGLMECFLAFGEDLKTDSNILIQNAHLNWLAYPGLQASSPPVIPGEVSVLRSSEGHEEELCRLQVDPADDVGGLKAQIAARTGVSEHSQRLLLASGRRELKDIELLSSVAPVGGGCVGVLLEQRSPEVVEWLTRLASEKDRKRKLQLVAEVPDELLEDAGFVLPAVQQIGKALVYASEELQARRDVVLAAVCQAGASLQHAAPSLRADPEVVLAALESDPWALEFAAPALQARRDVVLAAVREDGWVLKMAPPNLQTDREVVITAVMQTWEVLEIAAQEMRADTAVVLSAVRAEGCALRLAVPELQADRGVVLTAVRNNGAALKFAAFELQEDREIAYAAVSQSWQALGQLDPKLQDLDLALAAAKQDPRALQYVEPRFKAKVMEVLGVQAPDAPGPRLQMPNAEPRSRESQRFRRHFATLGMDERAAPEAIRKRYRQLALEHHPDKHPEDPDGAKRRFQLINSAYKAIKERFGY